MSAKQKLQPGDIFRHLIFSWFLAASLEYLLLPGAGWSLTTTDGISQMSFLRLLAVTGGSTLALTALQLFLPFRRLERWGIVAAFALLSGLALGNSFRLSFAVACGGVLLLLIVFALRGWNASGWEKAPAKGRGRLWLWLTAGAGLAFLLFVSLWTVGRVRSFCTPSFDFGLFSQMFHSMKTTGLPMTTLERDGLLSHFYVHVSPIYYLMLPFYCLVPRPETLQVLQAAVMASSVVPLWKLGKAYGLSGLCRFLLCLLLLLLPAFSGGAGYDLHENCFLTPLLLWLFYAMDKKKPILTVLMAALTLLVKEDAAVYVAIAGLWAVIRGTVHKKMWDVFTGSGLLAGAVVWFFLVTSFLANTGDGVMTYRYQNFMLDDSGSLVTVIQAVLLSPMKLLYECTDQEKLVYLAQTMLPLVGLPFLTRRYERLVLLIPYVLMNLMPDYKYQHDIFFQYNFGSLAFLLYLTAMNLADLRPELKRAGCLALATAVSAGFFLGAVVPQAVIYPQYCSRYESRYQQMRDTLDVIPEDASVAATTYYTTYLSQRDILYDVRYCTEAHLLEVEYVVLRTSSTGDYTRYGKTDGLERVQALLEENGFVPFREMPGEMVIYKKLSP